MHALKPSLPISSLVKIALNFMRHPELGHILVTIKNTGSSQPEETLDKKIEKPQQHGSKKKPQTKSKKKAEPDLITQVGSVSSDGSDVSDVEEKRRDITKKQRDSYVSLSF